MFLASWILLFLMATGAPGNDLPAAIREALCGDPLSAGYPTLVGTWALMTAAMMLPICAPALLIWSAGAVLGAGGQMALAKREPSGP